jgi:hypothetical protein
MIRQTRQFESQTAKFVGKKHGTLYREPWLSVRQGRQSLLAERHSIKYTFANLRGMLTSRIKKKLKQVMEFSRKNNGDHPHG